MKKKEFYLMKSGKKLEVTNTDDGIIQVTTNGGESWKKIP